MGLLEPVCLFWHKLPSDWQLRLDIPPAATTHAWLVMKNISSSSWLHTRHTKKYAHTLSKDLWHRSYIRLINLIWKVMATWQLFYSGSMLDQWRPTVLLMTVSSYFLVVQQFHFACGIISAIKHNILPTWLEKDLEDKKKMKQSHFFFLALIANFKNLKSDTVITRVGK